MKVIIVAISLLMTSQAFSKVWETKNQWNNTWERRFEHWVSTTWKEDIFSNRHSKYYGITTDCADASYTMRLIFAYERKLPFVIRNASKGNGKLITNDMGRWDGQHPLNKVKRFASYVNDLVSTKSMPADTYPSSMDKIGLAPGAVYVSPGSHSYQIISNGTGQIVDHRTKRRDNNYGVLTVGSSTVPRAIRDINFENNFPYYVPGAKKKDYSDGYRRFKWPQHIKMPALQVPNNTRDQKLSQYKIAQAARFSSMIFNESISRRLSKHREPIGAQAARLQQNLTQLIWQRDNVVAEGFEKSQQIRRSGRKCMNYSEYDAYSTPSRDKRLKQNFIDLKNLIQSPKYKARWNNPREWNYNTNQYAKVPLQDVFSGNRRPAPASRRNIVDLIRPGDGNGNWAAPNWVPYGLGRPVDYIDVWYAMLDNRLSSDPNNTIQARWGFAGRNQSGCKLY